MTPLARWCQINFHSRMIDELGGLDTAISSRYPFSKFAFRCLLDYLWYETVDVHTQPHQALKSRKTSSIDKGHSPIKACFRGPYFCRTIGSCFPPPCLPRGSSGLGFLTCWFLFHAPLGSSRFLGAWGPRLLVPYPRPLSSGRAGLNHVADMHRTFFSSKLKLRAVARNLNFNLRRRVVLVSSMWRTCIDLIFPQI